MKLSLDQSEYNDNEDTSLEDNAEKYRGPSPSPSVTACSSPLTPDAPLATTVDSPLQPASTAQSQPAANKSEEGVSELDIASRRDYLRQQRDKIVAMKRSVRKLRMDDLDVSSSASQRPKSAKSARNALESNTDVSAGNLTPDILAARQALARRLKTEVVAQHQTSN